MLAQHYERGQFAICDLFVSSRSTRVVYGLADPGVTGLPHITVAVIRFVVVLSLRAVRGWLRALAARRSGSGRCSPRWPQRW